MEDKSLKLTRSSEELRKLIMENPDLPIVVMAREDLYKDSGCQYTIASSISYYTGEYLDTLNPIDSNYDLGESVICDRDDLREKLLWYMEDEDRYKDLSDAEFDIVLDAEVKKYDPYWKKAIFIDADV